MLSKVKLLLGITSTDKDDLITLLIQQATEDAIMISHCEDVDSLDTVIIKMAVFNYRKLGVEAIESESYSGASFSYSSSYPDDILKILYRKRKLVAI